MEPFKTEGFILQNETHFKLTFSDRGFFSESNRGATQNESHFEIFYL